MNIVEKQVLILDCGHVVVRPKSFDDPPARLTDRALTVHCRKCKKARRVRGVKTTQGPK